MTQQQGKVELDQDAVSKREAWAKVDCLGPKIAQRKSAYFFPMRLCRHLPRPLIAVSDCLEAITPPPLPVLTFWHVCRK